MSIYKKIFEAKKEIGKISKDSKNPFYKSKYFDINQLLEHVEPILQKNDLLVLQPIEAEWVKSKIIDIESGETVTSEIHLSNINDPQKLGSEITYYRRYTLASLLGLQAEDDDANKTTQTEKSETPIVWLTDAQVTKAISEGKETIKKTLDWYNNTERANSKDGRDYKYCMSKANKTKLQNALK